MCHSLVYLTRLPNRYILCGDVSFSSKNSSSELISALDFLACLLDSMLSIAINYIKCFVTYIGFVLVNDPLYITFNTEKM